MLQYSLSESSPNTNAVANGTMHPCSYPEKFADAAKARKVSLTKSLPVCFFSVKEDLLKNEKLDKTDSSMSREQKV